MLLTRCLHPLGFNPWWDTELEFEVAVPELALVRFVVEDYDASSKNDFIGQSTIPLKSLKQGAAPVCGFSRGTTSRSVSLSRGAREVGSPCEWRGGARHCSRAMVGESGLETC